MTRGWGKQKEFGRKEEGQLGEIDLTMEHINADAAIVNNELY